MKFSVFSVCDHYPQLGRSARELYSQVIREMVIADDLGYDTYFVAEHHFHEYGIVPVPSVVLSNAASLTKRIHLGAAVVVLPFHHPLQVAEEYALLDQISDGRVSLGLGAGYLRHEFDGYGIDPEGKSTIFAESMAIIERAWKGDEINLAGKHFNISGVKLGVLPVQRPIPTWVAVRRVESAYQLGRQGRNIMVIPYVTARSLLELKEFVNEYLTGRSEVGHEGVPDIAAAFHVNVGATERKSADAMRQPLERYLASRTLAPRGLGFDQLDHVKLIISGNSARVRETVGQLADCGITHLMIFANYGAVSHELSVETLQRFSAEVIPCFR